MRERAHLAWTAGGEGTAFVQCGWRVIDTFGKDHGFFPAGAGGQVDPQEAGSGEAGAFARAREACAALNGGGAKRERETRRGG